MLVDPRFRGGSPTSPGGRGAVCAANHRIKQQLERAMNNLDEQKVSDFQKSCSASTFGISNVRKSQV